MESTSSRNHGKYDWVPDGKTTGRSEKEIPDPRQKLEMISRQDEEAEAGETP